MRVYGHSCALYSILESYANPRRILPSPPVFISGYAKTEKTFHCLIFDQMEKERITQRYRHKAFSFCAFSIHKSSKTLLFLF